MIKLKLKKNQQSLKLSLLSLAALPFASTKAFAQTDNWEDISEACVVGDVATIQGIMCMLANVLQVSLTVLGIVGFIMMIVGSARWLLSGGNSQEVEKAGKTMLYAVIGLILALSSFIIINLLAEFTGVDVIREFFIPPSDTGVNDLNEWNTIIN